MKTFLHICFPALLKSAINRVKASPLGVRLARGALWSLAGALLSRISGLFLSIVLARYLGIKGFGEFGIIQSTVVMLGTFAGFGLGATATKYVAEYRENDLPRAGKIIALSEALSLFTSALMALLLLFLSPWLAAHTLAAPNLTPLLKVSSLLLFFTAATNAQMGTLLGFEEFRKVALCNLLVAACTFVFTLIGVSTLGLPGAVWALVLSNFIGYAISHIVIRKEAKRRGIHINLSHALTEARILYAFSLPALLSGVLVGPINWVCNTLLVNQAGGYHEMGIFNAATQWKTAILFFPSTLSVLALPILSNLYGNSEKKKYIKVLSINMLINGGLTLLMAIGVSVLSRTIMGSYGPEFTKGASALILLSLSAVLFAITAVIGQCISSLGKMWWGTLLNIFWAAVFVGSSIGLVKYGAFGLALANLIAYSFHCVTSAIFSIFYLKRRGYLDFKNSGPI